MSVGGGGRAARRRVEHELVGKHRALAAAGRSSGEIQRLVLMVVVLPAGGGEHRQVLSMGRGSERGIRRGS